MEDYREGFQELERRLIKLEILLDEIKQRLGSFVEKSYCNARMESNGRLLEHLGDRFDGIEENISAVGNRISEIAESYITRDELFKSIIVMGTFLGTLFTIINIIISIVVK